MGVTAEGECASLCQSQGVTVYACASNGVPIACDRYRIDSIGDSIASKCCWLSRNLAECVGMSQLAIGLLRIGRLQVSSQGLMRSKVSSHLFTSVQFFDPANPMSIVWVFAVMALAVVLSFILTLLLGFEDIPVEEAAAQARKYQSVQPTVAKEVSLN